MHVKAKQIAVSGLLAAFAVILIVLGSVFESSTLFLLCGASFCVGIAVREWGIRYGAAFLVASTFLGLIVSPNKLYCVTFAVMGLYLWLTEILWNAVAVAADIKNRTAVLWCGKYAIFNLIYIPMIIFAPALFIAKEMSVKLGLIIWAAGQVGVLIFDKAHIYFQITVWNKIRKHVIK